MPFRGRRHVCANGLMPGMLMATSRETLPRVRRIVVAELALEIGFLAGDYAVTDDEGEGHQRQQQPEAVQGNGQADEPEHHAEVDGVARKAVGAAVDYGRG